MNLLRVAAVRSARLSRPTVRRLTAARSYATTTATQQPSSSSTPWFLGSLIVFGPILFKLTSPPPKKKKQEEHVQPVAPVVQQEAPVVKKIQKPYVLIGAGTASFAAAQAIKQKDPEANVRALQEKKLASFELTCLDNVGDYYW